MKVVINSCYGGFSLSPKGERRYLELAGRKSYFYKQSKYNFRDGVTEYVRIDNIDDVPALFSYCTNSDQGKTISGYPNDVFHCRDLERNDPLLVQVVEELGKESFGTCAHLEIVDVEKGRWFKIDEYDGYESIQYRDVDDEWILAE